EHFVGLDIESPTAATCRHRAVRLARERCPTARFIPHRIEDANSRIVHLLDELAGAVGRSPYIDDDLGADRQNRTDGGDDRVVERDGIPDNREPGERTHTLNCMS